MCFWEWNESWSKLPRIYLQLFWVPVQKRGEKKTFYDSLHHKTSTTLHKNSSYIEKYKIVVAPQPGDHKAKSEQVIYKIWSNGTTFIRQCLSCAESIRYGAYNCWFLMRKVGRCCMTDLYFLTLNRVTTIGDQVPSSLSERRKSCICSLGSERRIVLGKRVERAIFLYYLWDSGLWNRSKEDNGNLLKFFTLKSINHYDEHSVNLTLAIDL